MITEATLRALERRAAMVADAPVERLMLEVDGLLELVEGHGVLDSVYRELLAEAHRGVHGINATHEVLVAELAQIRDRFAEAAPSQDDSAMEPPADYDANGAFVWSLARFDRLRAAVQRLELPRLPTYRTSEFGARTMAKLLNRRLNTDETGDLSDLRTDVEHVSRRISEIETAYAFFSRSAASAAAVRLRDLRRDFRSGKRDPNGELDALFAAPLGRPAQGLFGTAHAEVDAVRNQVAVFVRALTERAESRRSLRAVMDRFALRASLYQAAELKALTRGRKKEDPLRDQLARYLFDNGFDAFTEPDLKLRPDIAAFRPRWELYVEAKQYSSKTKNLKGVAKRAVRQVLGTWPHVQGMAPGLSEAFLVFFRLDGPLLRFEPRELRVALGTLHLVLVDLDPTTAGSRTPPHVTLTEAELLSPQ